MTQQETQAKLDRHLSFLNQDENNLNLLLEVSHLYMELNDYAKAQPYLDRASAINREACLTYQGILHLKQDRFKEAINYCKEALAYEDTSESRYHLGFTYYMSQEFEQAWSILSTILDEEYLPFTQILMARILHQNNELEKAIALLDEHINNHPDDAEVLAFLSLLHFDNNHPELAKELSERALELNPYLYDAQLVDIMLRLLTQETNIEEIEHLLTINPEDSRLWFALGSTQMSQGDFTSAIAQYQKTLELHPEFYDCHIALGWCQLLNDDVKEAHESYQNAISLVDTLADGWGGLALIYALNADLEQAKQLIHKATDLDPECFLTQIAQVIYLNHTNPEQAKAHLLETLTNQNLPVSEKLAFVIEELARQADSENPPTVH
jgi:tetratricopeptide (TPR) repeat protein